MKIIPGEFITITERHCSDKVQPHIKVGGIYRVEKNDQLQDGTAVLVLTHNAKKKTTVRVNALRFTWTKISKKEIIAKKAAKQKADMDGILKQALDNKREDDRNILLKKFSFDERARISHVPLIIYNIAWMYAENCTKYAADHRISEVKKLSNAIKMLQNEYIDYLSQDMDAAHRANVLQQSKQFVTEHQRDFFILFNTTLNAINHQHIGISYDELRAYAYLSMQMIRACRKYEDDMTDMIRKRMRRADQVHLPYQDALYSCMDAYLGNFKITETQEMRIAMTIFRKNIDNIHYTVTND